MIRPIGYETDLGFRIAARYDLDFFISSEYSLTERGEYNPEHREPTSPELSMWYRIVPAEFRELLSKLWLTTEYLSIQAIPEELFCGLLYRQGVYLCAEDFAVARKLRAFKPELDRETLKSGKFGTFKDKTDIYVSREIPQGYCYPTDLRVEELHWQPPPNERQV